MFSKILLIATVLVIGTPKLDVYGFFWQQKNNDLELLTFRTGFSQELTPEQRVRLLKGLENFKYDIKNKVITYVRALLGYSYVDNIDELITLVSENPVDFVVRVDELVMYFDLNLAQISKVIIPYYSVSPGNLKQFTEQVKPLIDRLRSKGVSRDQERDIILILLDIKDSDRSNFISQVNQLIRPDMIVDQERAIMLILLQIEDSDRSEFVNDVNQLIRPYMRNAQVVEMFSKFSRFELGERSVVTQIIRPSMQGDQVIDIISNLLKVEEKVRSEFLRQVKELTRPDMSGYQVLNIISVLSQVGLDDRSEFIMKFKELVADNMNNEQRYFVINTIYKNKFYSIKKPFEQTFINEFINLVNSNNRAAALERLLKEYFVND